VSATDLVTIMRRSGTRKDWDAVSEAEGVLGRCDGVDPKMLIPDRFVSLDQMQPASWVENPRKEGGFLPKTWKPCGTEWVGVDLDRFDDAPLDDRALEKEGRRLSQWAKDTEHLSGAVLVIRTSHFGVQVLFGLDSLHSPAWKRSIQATALYNAIEARALTAAHRAGFAGGVIDRSMRAPGRLARRPGPRFDKNGIGYVSSLVFSVSKSELVDTCR